ncbi:hypothetical protein JKA74_18260 [Marivirga sp. S37H4]|uniref:Uncharacterized protein n=1 Tax=Marivirga aurantiaca TaxID=2802615 RepID=A0A935CBB5_9BACT|nr:hypothetical protein [Marivirga aurantiaca]MBK6266994.1 hypothetical protein [Marivirga aurantiaca]
MKKHVTYHPLLSTRLIKCLSTVLLIYFSSTILFNSFPSLIQESASTTHEYCDLPSSETEPLGDSESQKEEVKENCKEFIPHKKVSYAIFLEEKGRYYTSKTFLFKGRVSELLTPPPQMPFLV